MIRFSIIAIFCFALGCTSKKQEKKSKEIEELTKLAVISDSLKDLTQSISYYTQILEIDSTNLLAIINRGRALAFNGQIEEGFADYDRAIRLQPDERNYFVRGMIYVHLKNYDKASDDLQASIHANPKFGEAYWGLSFVKEAANDLDSAIFYCSKAAENNCAVEQALGRRAELYEKKGNFRASVDDWTKVIELDSSAICYNNRGYSYNMAQQYVEAIKDLDKAIELDSSNAFAYNNKAFATLKTGEVEKALTIVNISLKLNDKNPYAYKTRAEVYSALHQPEKACKDLATAEKLDVDRKLQTDIKALKEKICNK